MKTPQQEILGGSPFLVRKLATVIAEPEALLLIGRGFSLVRAKDESPLDAPRQRGSALSRLLLTREMHDLKVCFQNVNCGVVFPATRVATTARHSRALLV